MIQVLVWPKLNFKFNKLLKKKHYFLFQHSMTLKIQMVLQVKVSMYLFIQGLRVTPDVTLILPCNKRFALNTYNKNINITV